jgi:hypothetical protein
MGPETQSKAVHYAPGMDARSTRVAERLNAPMMVAAALTIPMVAISESHPGGALEDVARILNWVTWIAFAIELVAMLAVVPHRRIWLRHHPLDLIIVVFTPPVLPAGLQGLSNYPKTLRPGQELCRPELKRQGTTLGKGECLAGHRHYP